MTTQYLADAPNTTSVSIAPILAERWSPRGFDELHTIDRDELLSIIEAARWTPSAGNTQPWQFIAARRGTPEFDAIVGTLAGFNQVWAPRASALIVFVSAPARAGKMPRWAEYDLGQAAAHATIQAEHLGLRVHQMGGFSAEAIRTAFHLPRDVTPVSLMAIGSHDFSDEVPSAIRERDAGQRTRLPLTELLVRPIG